MIYEKNINKLEGVLSMSFQYTVFSNSQGSGYISNDGVIPPSYKPEPAEFCFGAIQPGEFTDIQFFSRKLKYIGRDGNELLFHIGSKTDLFAAEHYYQAINIISPTRIFMMYAHISGRDWNYINGEWK